MITKITAIIKRKSVIFMNREITLVKNTFIYMIGNFASKFLGFILLPLYTHYIPKDDFGYYDLIIATVSVIIPVITLQINDSMYRYMLDSKSKEETERIVTNSFFVSAAGVVVLSILYSVFIQLKPLVYDYLILVYIIATVFSGMWQQIARGLKHNMVYSISGVLYTIVMFLSNIVLIALLKMKADALLYSNIIASVSVIAYIEWNLGISRLIRIKYIHWGFTGELARYSIPLIPNAINWWVMGSCNKYIITYFKGKGANGIFSVSNKLPNLLMMINSVFYLAWQESAIGEYNSKDKDEFYTEMFNIYMRLLFSAILILLPMTKWILGLLVDPEYFEAWKYVPFLYLGALFNSFATFYGTGYLSSKDTKGAFTTSVAGAIVNIVFSLILMPVMGIQAASIANMLCYAAMWILRLIQTRKYFRIKIEKFTLMSMLLFTALYVTFFFIDNTLANLLLLAASIAIFFIYNKVLVHKSYNFIKNRLSLLFR